MMHRLLLILVVIATCTVGSMVTAVQQSSPQGWIDWGSQNLAAFYNLPFGPYQKEAALFSLLTGLSTAAAVKTMHRNPDDIPTQVKSALYSIIPSLILRAIATSATPPYEPLALTSLSRLFFTKPSSDFKQYIYDPIPSLVSGRQELTVSDEVLFGLMFPIILPYLMRQGILTPSQAIMLGFASPAPIAATRMWEKIRNYLRLK